MSQKDLSETLSDYVSGFIIARDVALLPDPQNMLVPELINLGKIAKKTTEIIDQITLLNPNIPNSDYKLTLQQVLNKQSYQKLSHIFAHRLTNPDEYSSDMPKYLVGLAINESRDLGRSTSNVGLIASICELAMG